MASKIPTTPFALPQPLVTPTALFAQPATNLHPPSPSAPTAIPALVYRVHRASAQTRYSFATGFSAKNQTTILNYTSALSRFGLAHLHQQTNISSPFVSVYDDLAHAQRVAAHWADMYGEEVWVVTVDTRHFARGPVFRAADLLKDDDANKADEWLHWGEYLVMYRVPAQAVRDQTPVGRGKVQTWRAVGVIGGA
ncbi:hypothetical protein EJ07DRAFT_159586 [Lizonia empirigonia]|nr:hypothetical protein EJ07DRAFT_159586 [Lizonia empirigonia]